MPRKLQANYFNFSGGLDTDSSILNRNPITVTDIDNCVLNLDASIENRNGLELLDGINLVDAFGYSDEPASLAYNMEFIDDTGTNRQFQVIRAGYNIFIYEGSGDTLGVSPMQTILTTYVRRTPDIRFDGDIFMFVTHNTLYSYKYNTTSNTFQAYESDSIQYRDYTTISASKYSDTTFTTSAETNDVHPLSESNTIWSSTTADPDAPEFEWNVVYASSDNVQVNKGVITISSSVSSYYLNKGNALKIEYSTGDVRYDSINEYYISGSNYIIILENLTETDNISNIQFSNAIDIAPVTLKEMLFDIALGRSFYTVADKTNRVYYSQIYTNEFDNIFKCHTVANPFDPIDSTVVSSDGGYFDIKGGNYIVGMQESSGSLLIFCENGIWEAVGTDGIFRADDFVLRKISDTGCESKDSIETVSNGVVYVSKEGINFITKDPNTGGLYSIVRSLTDGKIQTLIANLPKGNRKGMRATFNPIRNEIYFLYNANEFSVSHINEGDPTHYRNVLVLSLKLQAWYVWSLSDDVDMDKVSISDIYMTDYNSSDKEVVVSGSDETLLSDSGEILVTGSYAEDIYNNTPMVIMSAYGTSTNSFSNARSYIGFGRLFNSNDYDFEGTDYQEWNEATFSSAHQVYGNIKKKKSSNYLNILHEKTETGETNAHGYKVKQGGCYLRTSFDFANDPLSTLDAFSQTKNTNVPYGKYYNTYPTYRSSSSLNGNDFSGVSHLMYQHKVLGRGSVLQFNFKNKLNERWFKCTAISTNNSPILDTTGTYWEEIAESAYSGSEWVSTTAYAVNDTVLVSHPTHFKIVGWACELVPTEG